MPQFRAGFKLNPDLHKAWQGMIGDLASVLNKTDPESIHKLAAALNSFRAARSVLLANRPSFPTW